MLTWLDLTLSGTGLRELTRIDKKYRQDNDEVAGRFLSWLVNQHDSRIIGSIPEPLPTYSARFPVNANPVTTATITSASIRATRNWPAMACAGNRLADTVTIKAKPNTPPN